MKKLFKFLIAGIICVVIGGAICGGVVLYAIGNPEKAQNYYSDMLEKRGYYRVAENKTETIPVEGIDQFVIDLDSHDLMIYPTQEQEIIIKYSEEYKDQFTFSVSGGKVELKQKYKYDFFISMFPFGFLLIDYNVELFIPAGLTASLDSDVGSGIIQIENVNFANTNIDCSSGRINLKNVNSDNLQVTAHSGRIELDSINVIKDTSITSSSGRIAVDKLKSEVLNVKSSSGSVELSDIDCTGKIDVLCSSGRLDCNDVTAGSLYAKIQSGSTEFVNLNIAGDLSISSSSGRTDVVKAICNNLIISSSSGSVTADASGVRQGVNIKCSSGRVTVNGVDKSKSSFDLNTDSGRVVVFGVSKGDDYKENPSGSTVTIKVDANSGSIYIN